MNGRVAEAEEAVSEMLAVLRYKKQVICLVQNQLADPGLFVSKERLLEKQDQLVAECCNLLLELALHQQYIDMQTGSPFVFLS